MNFDITTEKSEGDVTNILLSDGCRNNVDTHLNVCVYVYELAK